MKGIGQVTVLLLPTFDSYPAPPQSKGGDPHFALDCRQEVDPEDEAMKTRWPDPPSEFPMQPDLSTAHSILKETKKQKAML